MKKISLLFLLCATTLGFSQSFIPATFQGANYWMPFQYIYGPTLGGAVDYQPIQSMMMSAGTKVYRIGGNGYDTKGKAIGNNSNNNDYIKAINNVKAQNPNAKFLIQVPFLAGGFTKDSAAKLVGNISNFFPGEKFYYAIGNEWDFYRHAPNKKYFNYEIANAIKSYAIEIKNADTTSRILAPALAVLLAKDSLGKTILRSLLCGPDTLSQIINGSPYASINNKYYYIDGVDFHTYGGGSGNLYGTTNYTAYYNSKNGLINYAGVAGQGLSRDLDSLFLYINKANTYRNASKKLTFAITEMNVCYKNQPRYPTSLAPQYRNTAQGLSARSFFCGQNFMDIYSTVLNKAMSAGQSCEFIMPWSIHEGGGDGDSLDLSMTKGPASSSQAPSPVSSYHHYKLFSDYFTGRFFSGTNNKQPIVKTFSSVEDSAGIYVMVLNRDTIGSQFSIGFQNNAPTAPLKLTYNIPSTILPLDSANTYPSTLNPTTDSIGPNTTIVMLFNCHGRLMWKQIYSLQDAISDGQPHLRQINNVNVDPLTAACSNIGIGGHINTNTTYSNTTVNITSNILLTGNTKLTFDNALVVIAPNVSIKGNPNSSIEIKNGSVLFGCNGQSWAGIELQGNHQTSETLKIENSLIFNAKNTVLTNKVSSIDIKNSVLANGVTALEFQHTDLFNVSGNIIGGYTTGLKTSNTSPNYYSAIKENQFIQIGTGLDFTADAHNLLKIACNSFYGYTNKAILSRATTLAPQGDSTMSAGNTFYKQGSVVPTDYIDHTGSATAYYFGPSESPLYAFPVMNIPKVQALGDRFCGVSSAAFNCKQLHFVGIQEHDQNELPISIYPNPGTGVFILTLPNDLKGESTLIIYDVIGRIISSRKVYATEKVVTFEIVAKGLYLVSFKNSGNMITKKVIVE